jgi:predicted MFS family arabinose efflux permease
MSAAADQEVPAALGAAEGTAAAPPSLPEEESAVLHGRQPISRVFRHRNYRLYFVGQLTSLLGTWMQQVAQGWLVYDLTHSAWLLGLTTFVGQIPILLGSSFGGTLADWMSKRDLLLWTQISSAVQALILTILTMLGIVQVWHVIALSALMGVITAVDMPARQAFTIELVGRQDLRHAIALNSIMFNAARIVGPSAAGILVAIAGVGICFAINTVSYAAMLAALWVMKLEPLPERPKRSAWNDVKDGFRYVFNHAPILAALLLLAACNLFGGAYVSLMPVFASDVFHQGSQGLGFLMTATGAGALTGAYTMTYIPERYLPLALIIVAGMFGVALVLFSQSPIFLLSLALLVPVAFSLMTQAATTNTFIQSHCSEDMRGRVMAFFAMATQGTVPIGALLMGWLADGIGAPKALTLGGAGCIIAAIVAHSRGHLRMRT